MDISILGVKEVLYEGQAEKVILPAFDGEICVLDWHESFLCRLRGGIIKTGDAFFLEIKDGVARMKDNKLVIMVTK